MALAGFHVYLFGKPSIAIHNETNVFRHGTLPKDLYQQVS
jgi:hypothetical protein